MKRYYLVEFSWNTSGFVKIEECKLFTDINEALLVIANNSVMTNKSLWISEQINQIKRNEYSITFPCKNKIVVTSDYPEKPKGPLRLRNHISKILCDTIIEAERDIKIDDILNKR